MHVLCMCVILRVTHSLSRVSYSSFSVSMEASSAFTFSNRSLPRLPASAPTQHNTQCQCTHPRMSHDRKYYGEYNVRPERTGSIAVSHRKSSPSSLTCCSSSSWYSRCSSFTICCSDVSASLSALSVCRVCDLLGPPDAAVCNASQPAR